MNEAECPLKKEIYRVDSAYAWVVAFSSLGLATIGSGIFYLVAIAIVPQVTELGISAESASLPYGAAMVGMGIGGILMGWVADKKGPFGPAILGSLSIAAGCYLISEIRDFNVIVYGLLLGALGNAALVQGAQRYCLRCGWCWKCFRGRGVATNIILVECSIRFRFLL